MKINFEMSGGFAHIPSLSGPLTIDTTQVDPQVANQLESLVREAHFFDQAAQTGTIAKGAADYRTYNITVIDGTRIHTIHVTDPIKDANLGRLISQLRTIDLPSKP
jgi:hypothetical protein